MDQVFGSTNRLVEALVEENKLLRAVVDAADKYDNGGSYLALRQALNKWRKAKDEEASEREKRKNDRPRA
jgi:hypothetical protein